MESDSDKNNWPCVVRFYLSLLGYVTYSSYRTCANHSASDEPSAQFQGDTERSEESQGLLAGQNGSVDVEENVGSYGAVRATNCRVCQHLNRQGSSKDIRSPSCHQDCAVKVWLGALITLYGATMVQKIYTFFSDRRFVLFMLSYVTHYSITLAIVVLRLVAYCSPLKATATRGVYALSGENVLGLLGRVDLFKHKRCGYIFLLFPAFDIIILSAYELYPLMKSEDCEHIDPWSLLSYICEIVECILFCSFWCLVFLLRKALQTDLRHLIPFLNKNKNNIALSRKRLYESYLEFTRINQLVSNLMIFQMSMVTFKTSCHIYWNYFTFPANCRLVRAHLINYLIWFQIFMFLALPLFAIGGLNIQYVWQKFLANVEREQTDEKYWSVFLMIKHLGRVNSNVILIVVFSVLTLFVSLGLETQNAEYWVFTSICQGICTNATRM